MSMRNKWMDRGLWALIGVVGASAAWGTGVAIAGADDDGAGGRARTPTAEWTDDTEESTPPVLTGADFEVGVSVTDRECFGSAGCSVEFRINPDYVGFDDPGEGHYLVTYEVRGVEDGPQIGSFELEGDSISFEPEGYADTTGPTQKITAKVTKVELLPY